MSGKIYPKVIDWFLCDDIREEIGGKVSYMGIYGDDILCATLPAILPKIALCMKLEIEKEVEDKIFLKITQPDGQPLIGPLEVKLARPINPAKSKKARIHIAITPFIIQKTGSHKLLISIDGKKFEEIGGIDVGLQLPAAQK